MVLDVFLTKRTSILFIFSPFSWLLRSPTEFLVPHRYIGVISWVRCRLSRQPPSDRFWLVGRPELRPMSFLTLHIISFSEFAPTPPC